MFLNSTEPYPMVILGCCFDPFLIFPYEGLFSNLNCRFKPVSLILLLIVLGSEGFLVWVYRPLRFLHFSVSLVLCDFWVIYSFVGTGHDKYQQRSLIVKVTIIRGAFLMVVYWVRPHCSISCSIFLQVMLTVLFLFSGCSSYIYWRFWDYSWLQ